jgi:ABC-type Mn2+/Zn2+ transport system permease subunit
VDWLLDPFRPEFMQRALLAGVLVVIVCSLVGTWVVLRGLTFMGDALAHGVIPGISLAFLVGFDLVIGALLSAAVMVAGVTVVARRARLAEDVGIGLLFVGMLALGVVIISRSGAFAVDLTGFLFGDVLGVTNGDNAFLAVAAAIALGASLLLYRPFLALAFDERKAQTLGLHPRLAHVAMLALVALAIVASFRAVGTLLVFGLLVGPPATASLLVRRLPLMIGLSLGFGWLAVVAGLIISWHAATAAGATMSGLSVALFFVVLSGREAAAVLGRRARAGISA